MKTTLLLLILAFNLGFAQNHSDEGFCGSDHANSKALQDPKMKAQYLQLEADIQKELLKMNSERLVITGQDTVYEIPVVVHIIHTGDAVGTQYNKSDAEIISWIEEANQFFAATHPTSDPIGGGGVRIPIRLALAKRDPNCLATTGINRIDGTILDGYDQYGLRGIGTDGVTEDQVRNLSRWNSNYYYNVYIVNKFDGNNGAAGGLQGYAYFPFSGNIDGAYMVSSVVINNNNTLVHEMGHALNLAHTFDGDFSNGGVCPSNANCLVDNDKVCDTEPGQNLINSSCLTAEDINPCTGVAYEGVQWNIMNYTPCPKRFTVGQRDRALATMRVARRSQGISFASLALTEMGGSQAVAASCVPTSTANPGNQTYMGPIRVVFNTIDFSSSGASGERNRFYIDRSSEACFSDTYQTTIQKETVYPMSITTHGNAQKVAVWIDYNNNASFEADELVLSKFSGAVANETVTANISAPVSAVENVPLRMRVYADFSGSANPTPCGNPAYGQVEDYVVILIPKVNQASTQPKSEKEFEIYPNPSKDGNFVIRTPNAELAKVELLDAAARQLNQFKIENNSANQLTIQTFLPNGFYILKVSVNGKNYTEKLILKK